EVLQSHNLPSDRWQETLTKASIVQKEVSGHDYYGKVARVIDNRLSTESTNGLLGMDTVIAYGLGINAMNLTKAQLDDDTNPYNDRIHAGLPPSPISNPGQDAIEAVINPPEGDWIYFCTVNLKTGDTRFTNSSLEFDKYKAEYENWLKQNPNFDED
ncbi:MAG: endolytic transglycosylase MltG, partial [Bifidobacteriaceae bacterium]|nr:endolytic transglycosylase MltG [Bifidobacteriaceae bacterium]